MSTYLITGGLGGLGFSVARWMVQQGARHLVLLGRSGGSASVSPIVDEMRAAGVDVRIEQADAAEPAAMNQVIAAIDLEMPRLAGVVHAAGGLAPPVLPQVWSLRAVRASRVRPGPTARPRPADERTGLWRSGLRRVMPASRDMRTRTSL